MIVVDTDVTAYFWVRRGTERPKLADAVRLRDPIWTAPAVWLHEFRNVLASYMRFRDLDLDSARRIMMTAEADLSSRVVPVSSDDVLRLVSSSKATSCDCEYIAAARALGCPLVTGDRKLADAFPETAVTMEAFAAGR